MSVAHSRTESLETMEDSELAGMWKVAAADMAFSQGGFCRICQINASNFSRWLSGKRLSSPSRIAVITFLRSPTSFLRDAKMPAPERSLEAVAKMSGDLAHSARMLKITQEAIIKAKPSLVLFIDGDNSIPLLTELLMLDSSSVRQRVRVWSFQNRKTMSFIKKTFGELFLLPDWFHASCTITDSLDAADHSLSMEATLLDLVLSLDVPFSIVTNDGFKVEVGQRLRLNGRKCSVLKTSSDKDYRLILDSLRLSK